MHRLILIPLIVYSLVSLADKPVFEIDIRDHLFIPAEITIPAQTKVRLVINNRDQTPEEFESYELNREKVIMGGRKANIFIGPLEPGTYPFFGEFNPKTAQGKVTVK
ncbi:cupredoxin domain-containing protein [Oceanicoccus sp. KOV_DT_Chl]|uniref:cupredoxin domain-containing protein n=1 Tax=Oceanicoccus sp. KOV_DT_Chl TaxID=1904639 RepID=UPI000C7B53F9|nr:cupredoxin domain-containing protein [Oceanicoccus sp. KOV_DT_Chl]